MMTQYLKLFRRKVSTAFKLLQHGEFERVQALVETELEKKFPILKEKNPSQSSKRYENSGFNPLSAKPREPIPRNPLQLRPKPTVAAILDEFSEKAWSHEFNLVNLSSHTWKSKLDSVEVDFLFVESTWRGAGESWKGLLNRSSQASHELRLLIEYCQSRNIPTVFWNKEDPTFFDQFLPAASLFDYVFTTDADRVPSYKEANPDQVVDVLPFAAQPAIHNPARNRPETAGFPRKRIRVGGVAFAGSYFAERFPNRQQQLEMILSGARDAAKRENVSLAIFSRMNSTDPRYRFPQKFLPFVVGSLSYSRMLNAFQEHKVFLNVNTVTDSTTMCARRLFEIPASGTQVVSTPAKAIREYFPRGTIPVVSSDLEVTDCIRSLLRSPLLNDKILHRTQRVIWNQHTYAHRAELILDALGLNEFTRNDLHVTPRISIICSTIRPDNLDHLLKQIGRQVNVEVELILGTHGFGIDSDYLGEIAESNGVPHQNVYAVQIPEHFSLGASLNQLVEQTSFPLITKMDDDDSYLPHYLEDLAYALEFSGADLVGKQAVYAHLGNNEVILRNPEKEHIFTHFVIGPTLFGYRETFLSHPFEDRTHGEDTQFLKSILAGGGRIYSTDRFNFVQQRAGSHTWDKTDLQFLAESRLETWGTGESHADA